MASLSTVTDLVQMFSTAKDYWKKGTTPSLTAYTKQVNIMSRLYIEDSILRDDICVPLVGVLNQLYVSYILAALNMDAKCVDGRTVREQLETVATENQNVVKGDVITLDTTSSYIRGGKRTIATIGLDDVVIVDSDDALLVAAKGKIQDVKKIAEQIKARG